MVINLGGYDKNSFFDSNGVAYLTRFLQRDNTIKALIASDDKIPNLDGIIQVLDNVNEGRATPKQIFHVQVKTINSDYQNNNKTGIKSQYKYSADTKVFNTVKNHITSDPVLLFLVDEENDKIFWFHVSLEYVMGLNIKEEKNKTIYFSDCDQIIDIKKFYQQLIFIHEEKVEQSYSINKNMITTNTQIPEICQTLQDESDYLNDILKEKFRIVTDFLYPDTWKFGIAFLEQDDHNVIGIYHIKKGTNDKLIKDFSTNVKDCFSITSYKKDKTSIRSVINKQIELMAKKYYKIGWVSAKYLSNLVLEEISFYFLDILARVHEQFQDVNYINIYYKTQENVSELSKYWNALISYAIKEVDIIIKEYGDHDNVTCEINPLGSLLSCVVLNKNEAKIKFLKVLSQIDNQKIRLPYPLVYSNEYPYLLFEEVIQELEYRGIKIISRPYQPKKYLQMLKQYENIKFNNMRRVETGYLIEDIYRNMMDILKILPSAYKFTVNELWGQPLLNHIVGGKYSIAFQSTDLSCSYYVLKSNDYDFNIVVNEYTVEELKQLFNRQDFNNFNAISIDRGSFYNCCRSDTIIYDNIFYLLNFEMWNKCDIAKPSFGIEFLIKG